VTWAHQSEGVEVEMPVVLTSDMEMEHKQCEGAGLAKETEETCRAGSPRGLSEGVGERLGAGDRVRG